jgi:hypothetical protein
VTAGGGALAKEVALKMGFDLATGDLFAAT